MDAEARELDALETEGAREVRLTLGARAALVFGHFPAQAGLFSVLIGSSLFWLVHPTPFGRVVCAGLVVVGGLGVLTSLVDVGRHSLGLVVAPTAWLATAVLVERFAARGGPDAGMRYRFGVPRRAGGAAYRETAAPEGFDLVTRADHLDHHLGRGTRAVVVFAAPRRPRALLLRRLPVELRDVGLLAARPAEALAPILPLLVIAANLLGFVLR